MVNYQCLYMLIVRISPVILFLKKSKCYNGFNILTALTSCCANCTHLTDLTLEIRTEEALYYNINRLKIKGLSKVPTQMLISKRLLILNIDCEKMYPEGRCRIKRDF